MYQNIYIYMHEVIYNSKKSTHLRTFSENGWKISHCAHFKMKTWEGRRRKFCFSLHSSLYICLKDIKCGVRLNAARASEKETRCLARLQRNPTKIFWSASNFCNNENVLNLKAGNIDGLHAEHLRSLLRYHQSFFGNTFSHRMSEWEHILQINIRKISLNSSSITIDKNMKNRNHKTFITLLSSLDFLCDNQSRLRRLSCWNSRENNFYYSAFYRGNKKVFTRSNCLFLVSCWLNSWV